MILLSVLLIGFAIEHDALVIRNSHLMFRNQRPAGSATSQHRRHWESIGNLVLTARGGKNKKNENTDAELFLLEYSIDSFLRGDYDRTFSEDAAAPLPGLSPSDTVDAALRSLRNLDEPEPSHGAAVFLRFCAELGKGERWGTTSGSSSQEWTELLRGALTPTMLARRIRASEKYSSLLDWKRLYVAPVEGNETSVFRNENVGCVEASLYFDGKTSSPDVYIFKLAKMLGGVWLIESVQKKRSSLAPTEQSGRLKNPRRSSRKNRDDRGTPSRPQRGKLRREKGKPKLFDSSKDENKTDENASK